MNGRQLQERLNEPGCTSGKRGYKTEAAAESAMRGIVRDPRLRTGKQPSRAYECPGCGRWHLTSKRRK